MSQPLDRAGNFRGRITSYELREHDSGTVGIAITVAIDDFWNGESWEDWKQYEFECLGEIFVIKKDGSTNTKAVESLVQHAGWAGTFGSISSNTWQPKPISFSAESNVYKDLETFRVAFLNEYDAVPGKQSKVVAPDKVNALDARHGGCGIAHITNIHIYYVL